MHPPHFRWLLLVTILLAGINLGFSTIRVTPQSLCGDLTRAGLVRDCRAGVPWAFETTRYRNRWTYDTIGDPFFHCYQGDRHGPTHRDCRFRGALLQFDTDGDLDAGLQQIRAQNTRQHDDHDLAAGVVRADTTLEHYAFYVLPAVRLLVIVPVSARLDRVRAALPSSGTVVDL